MLCVREMLVKKRKVNLENGAYRLNKLRVGDLTRNARPGSQMNTERHGLG